MILVAINRHGLVSVITVNNPPVNALSQGVREGLLISLQEANSDPETKSIVIICAGRTFIAGADIREFDKPPEAPHLPDVVSAIEASEKLVLAAICGNALGGGLEVALGCHYRMAAVDAVVGLPEVKLGLIPGAGGPQRVARRLGPEKALGIVLTGDPVGAEDAWAMGIVDEVAGGAPGGRARPQVQKE